MEYNKISSKSIKEWVILRTIWVIITAAIAVVVTAAFISFYGEKDRTTEDKIIVIILQSIGYIYVYAMFIFSVIYAYVFPKLQYKNYKYRITDEMIEVRRGVIFKHAEFVPFVRLQHVQVFRSLTDRIFGMSTITLFTAGSFVRITNIDKDSVPDMVGNIKKLVANLTVEEKND